MLRRGMAPTPFVLLLGLIGMNIAGTKQERLPPPRLTLLSPGGIYKGQSADLQCTAPGSFQESIFYLYKRDSGNLLQTQHAPEATSTVIFTLHGLTDSSSGNYVCTYQARQSEAFQTSDTSNMEYLTVLDVPVSTTPAPDIGTTLQVPFWIVVMAGAVTGIVVLVLLVTASVAIVRKFKEKKKHEQREKESSWISGNMDTGFLTHKLLLPPSPSCASDAITSHPPRITARLPHQYPDHPSTHGNPLNTNKVQKVLFACQASREPFRACTGTRHSSDTETSPSHMASRDPLGEGRTGKPVFSSFHA
ncbi:uncharacterized protein LOC128491548 [Spea bombifrons]|uniref:uncharacterized protein LOC128491548 n=1 Tax=Spea bombifrons TaxID=233779 RepID=UPI00234B6753|nr:uncharacterized protein LOC128491548 [Spea bombifrons]